MWGVGSPASPAVPRVLHPGRRGAGTCWGQRGRGASVRGADPQGCPDGGQLEEDPPPLLGTDTSQVLRAHLQQLMPPQHPQSPHRAAGGEGEGRAAPSSPAGPTMRLRAYFTFWKKSVYFSFGGSAGGAEPGAGTGLPTPEPQAAPQGHSPPLPPGCFFCFFFLLAEPRVILSWPMKSSSSPRTWLRTSCGCGGDAPSPGCSSASLPDTDPLPSAPHSGGAAPHSSPPQGSPPAARTGRAGRWSPAGSSPGR